MMAKKKVKKIEQVSRLNKRGQKELLAPDHAGLWYNPKLKVRANRKARKRSKK